MKKTIFKVAVLSFSLLFSACSEDSKTMGVNNAIEPVPATAPLAEKRPNVLLIVVDDMAYNDLSIHGSEIQTPNIDTLLSNGVAFDNFHKVKLPLARQDVARFARRMGIPCNPPPPTTDPTPAGLGSLLAEEKDCLEEYVTEVMRCEWAGSNDIGQREVLVPIAESIGLDKQEFEAVLDDPASQVKLDENWQEAQSLGVIGVPTFVVNDQIFWGNDRMDFLEEYLLELRLLNI